MAYTSIITNYGAPIITNAAATGNSIPFATVVLGDGNGGDITPVATMTALVNQVTEAAINGVAAHPTDPTSLIVTAIVERAAIGFIARELGLRDSGGGLIAIASIPDTEIPALSATGAKLTILRFPIHIGAPINPSWFASTDPAVYASSHTLADLVGSVENRLTNILSAGYTLNGKTLDMTGLAEGAQLVYDQTSDSFKAQVIAETLYGNSLFVSPEIYLAAGAETTVSHQQISNGTAVYHAERITPIGDPITGFSYSPLQISSFASAIGELGVEFISTSHNTTAIKNKTAEPLTLRLKVYDALLA